MEGDHISPAQDFLEGEHLQSDLSGPSLAHVGVVGDGLHPECVSAPRDLAAYAPRSNEPQHLAPKLTPGEAGAEPLPRAHGSIRRGDSADQGENEREGQLGHGDGVPGRRVEDRNSRLRRRLEIDVVDAGPSPSDHAEPGRMVQEFARHPCLRAHDQAMRSSDLLAKTLRIPFERQARIESLIPSQWPKTGGRHLIGHDDREGLRHARSPLRATPGGHRHPRECGLPCVRCGSSIP